MPQFRQLSDTLLRGRWFMHDYLTWAPGSHPFHGNDSPELSGIDGYGYYEEEYERRGDEWRIAFMRLTRIRTDLRYGPVPEWRSGTLPPTLDWLS